MRIEDISPRHDNTSLSMPGTHQCVSGKAFCCAISADGSRAYVGGHSGVWRSDDGGLNWWHPEWPQPKPGSGGISGALPAFNVHDLLVSPISPDIVHAVCGYDAARPSRAGVYRSTDGAVSWQLMLAYRFTSTGSVEDSIGTLANAPDDPRIVYALIAPTVQRNAGAISGARNDLVARSLDSGASWEILPSPRFSKGFWHIAAGPSEGARRRVYMAGKEIVHSIDGGMFWTADPFAIEVGPIRADGPGGSSRSIAVHPGDPSILYVLASNGVLWRGRFPPLPQAGGAEWTELPGPPQGYEGTTPSGTGFILAHLAMEGGLQLLMSDRSTVHIAEGEPASSSSWRRIEDGHCHLDPRNLTLTPDFSPASRSRPRPEVPGRALMVNDGGVVLSTDGAKSWVKGRGLSTLAIVNAAVNAARGRATGLCIGMPDNSGFSTENGGASWSTQHYQGGDQDCCFSDPFQPERLIVLAPRADDHKLACFVYRVGPGGPGVGFRRSPPFAAAGALAELLALRVAAPPRLADGDGRARGHNAVSNFYNAGYRPLVLTRKGEAPRSDGDFILIRFTADQALLMRTTRMSKVTSRLHWVSNATGEGSGVRTFRQGPPLPDPNVCTVQASGGHNDPVYYVGDQFELDGIPPRHRLWTWKRGMTAWRPLVPFAGRGPFIARRYFVDPYRPKILYVLDDNHIWRSEDGGASWRVDGPLERAMTDNGLYPFRIGELEREPEEGEPPSARITDGTPDPVLLRDMQFDPTRPGCRFAIGPAGIFHSQDGRKWTRLVHPAAVAAHMNNAFYDPVSCPRALYVATYGRGLLRIEPVPPDWDFPIGGIQWARGRIEALRVNDAGSGFGSPEDRLDAEVVVQLDSEPEKAFGIRLRPGAEERKARAMLDLLRDAFRRDAPIRIEFRRTGCRTALIIRVIET